MPKTIYKLNPQDINHRIVAAIMIVFKRPEVEGAHLTDDETGVTYCVTYEDDVLKISVGNGPKKYFNNLLGFLTSEIGKPNKTYTKESSLHPGQMISYMEWVNR